MGIVKTVAKNSLMVVLSTIVTRILSLIFSIFVARYLGSINFGKYSFVFALVSIFTVFVAFGMDALVIREIAKDKSKSNIFLTNSGFLKVFFSLLAFLIVIFLLIPIFKKGSQVNIGIIIISLCLLPDSIIGSFKAVFSGHERMEYNTFLEITFRMIIVGLGLLVVFFNYGLISLFSVSLVANLSVLLLAFYIYNKIIGKIVLHLDCKLCKYLLKTSFPFLMAGIFVSIYHRVDVILLSKMQGDAVVGWYSAARGLTDALLFIPAAICSAIFPVFSRMQKDSREPLKLAYKLAYRFLLLLALPVAFGTAILADKIIILIYKAEFSNSIVILRILIWSTAVAFLNIVMSTVLYTINRQKTIAFVVFIMACLSTVLNWLLIPKYSYVGASWVAVVTEVTGFIFCCYYISKLIGKIALTEIYLKTFLSILGAAAFLYKFKDANIFLAVPLSILLYVFILIVLRTFNEEDKKIIRELVTIKK